LPGIILETTNDFLSITAVHLSSFNELRTSYLRIRFRQRILIHSLLTENRRWTTCEQIKPANEIRPKQIAGTKLFTVKTTREFPL